ncbi:serine/threonine protein kinase [Mycolicibacterium wolinskyi]|uniref:serine/threonine-protein kinase n=1 Tax=Mycolicibacterium TaxID=1866885 RepID=UPI000DA14231|nr:MULTISPECIES: serine/threonine-protein kinase [Mycolicibacterium]MCV7284434.1 serine/threonine protein kinase [Mycolicibacterium wolinskyi]MCV7291823.1 serine/threonine protein kinase [Mycolicibacterium goodii]
MVESPGETIAGYAVEEVVGRGGWAVVYRARDGAGRAVALKVLDDAHREPDHLARLQREFDFAGRVEHPNIVKVFEAGPAWLAMELIDGGTVSALPTTGERLTALRQIAAALDHAHRLGIVHCDVKPTNILVDQSVPADRPRAVLIDFGVAHSVAEDVAMRLSHDGGRLTLDPAKRIARQAQGPHPQVQASLPYSAPELLCGRSPSAATDEYALACTTVELLTGSPPFAAKTAMGMVDQQLQAAPPRISRQLDWIPHAVDSILAKALAKDPERRYDSCAEFIGLIANALR